MISCCEMCVILSFNKKFVTFKNEFHCHSQFSISVSSFHSNLNKLSVTSSSIYLLLYLMACLLCIRVTISYTQISSPCYNVTVVCNDVFIMFQVSELTTRHFIHIHIYIIYPYQHSVSFHSPAVYEAIPALFCLS